MPTWVSLASRWRCARGLALALAAAAAAAGPVAAEPASRIVVGKTHRLRVTHATRVRIEEGTTGLTVTHAKPLERTWPGLKAPLAVGTPTLLPAGGREIRTRTEGGQAWTWEVAAPPLGEQEYVSTFELVSADRELKTAGLVIRWTDLPPDPAEAMQGQPALPVANALVREAVAKVRKKSKDVIDGLTAFTQWVGQNVAYTPGVPYATDDLEAICRGRGGNCGHRATVFLAMCQAAGIPARRVVGLALLNQPRGAGADDGNRHVWAQVHLPTLGWVEIEPAPHGSPFAIPHTFVMCPFDLQARFVSAVAKSGERVVPLVSDTVRMEPLK